MLIYVVDDEADVRNVISIALQRAGHSVQSFASADAFLAVADDLSPGCILLDYCMPGTDGLEAQQQLLLRKSPHRIILFTGVGEIPEAVRAIRAGAIDVLTKPYRRSELMDAILRAGIELEKVKAATIAPQTGPLALLSDKELSVLNASADGKSSKQVAFECGLSVRTIEMHRSSIIRKLGTSNFAGALLIHHKCAGSAMGLDKAV